MLTNLLRAIGAGLLGLSRRSAAVPIALWSGLIFWLGSWSSSGVGGLGVTTFLTNLLHAPLFGLFALWLALALPREGVRFGGWPRLGGRERWLVLALVALAGLADEVHQHLGARGRDFSLLDIGTNLAGAAAVLAVIAYLGRDGAGDRGLAGRLAAGLAGCAVAAAAATFLPDLAPSRGWL